MLQNIKWIVILFWKKIPQLIISDVIMGNPGLWEGLEDILLPVEKNWKKKNTGGSQLSRTVVNPDSRLAQIFFSKICFPISCII